MALPPGFLEDLRARVSLADVVGRKVTWDRRKSQPGKGDWWAPCPFHQEKTPSFHVDDRQGYYYCFGCHAKGDAITYLREAEGMAFLEAVEELAGMAGMEVPKADPKAAARAETRASLTDVMERAVQHYRAQLATPAAAGARAYLERRGLRAAALERFEIGFAPPGWEGLRTALAAGGVEVAQLLACGLVRPSDKGRAPYDTFRDRIIFPIRDARGRAIAFGGRAMEEDKGPKYLNSPDTELFDKSRTLYNHGPARAACAKGAALIVAEGYMDVIALAEAGFAGAVAPLGTAVTAEHLAMLWKIHDEPVVALDGDRAGLEAGHRLMDLALPLIAAGQSLRFALLPAGQDPDDVIRAGGAEAMQAVLDAAVPMVELMWRRATEGRVFDSPERRAALDRELRQAVGRVSDPSLRSHYGHALRERRAALFGYGAAGQGGGQGRPPQGQGAGRGARPWRGWRGAPPPPEPMPATRAALRAAAGNMPDHLREAVILATLLAHPALIEEFAHRLEETDFTGTGHAALAHALLTADVLATEEQIRHDIAVRLGPGALERLTAPRHVQLSPGLRRKGDVDAARACLSGEFDRLESSRGAAREVAEAMDMLARAPAADAGAFAEEAGTYAAGPAADGGTAETGDSHAQGEADDAPDTITWRLAEAARARGAGDSVSEADRTEYDIAENGARIDRRERGAFEALLRTIGHDASRPGETDGDT